MVDGKARDFFHIDKPHFRIVSNSYHTPFPGRLQEKSMLSECVLHFVDAEAIIYGNLTVKAGIIMTPEEFDINFDFDSTYGTDPNADKCSFDDDFDLDAALARELGPDFERLFEEEYAASQAALNAQIAAANDMMEATRIRLEIGHDDSDKFVEEDEEDEEPEVDDGPKEADEIRESPVLAGFSDADEEEDEMSDDEDDARADDEDYDPDEDLSTFFAAVASSHSAFFNEEADPAVDDEDEEEPEKNGLKALVDKIDFAAIGASFAAAGSVIADNARRFVSALKECKPGKMDRQAKRRFKDDVLPVLIGGTALVVCIIFIAGALSRGPSLEERQQAALQESIAQAEAEAQANAEIQKVLNDAAAHAMVYDYQTAIDTLDSYKTENRPLTDEMNAARAQYAEAVNTLVIWDDPTAIPNLSFHVLIADTDRAYADDLAGSYKSNFVTTTQFAGILEQLYSNGYVLVNLDSCLMKNSSGESTVQPVYLPEGKKPIMITETLVNYFGYMVDGNEDGIPDAEGAGFANKLVLENGVVKAAYIDAQGNELVGDYDLVPILDSFISEHPDFSYRGAKAILAVTGEEGVFGWRTTGGDEATIAGAQEVVAALQGSGYQIACNSFGNLNYGSTSMEEITSDLSRWDLDAEPVLGEVDILVVARGGEMTPSSSRFQTVQQAGFRYILDAGTQGSSLENGIFYQNRTMVMGSTIASGDHAAFFTLTAE